MSEQNSIGFAVVAGVAAAVATIVAEDVWNTLAKKPRSSVDSVAQPDSTSRQTQR